MPSPQAILPILELLSLAYPEKRMPAETMQVYLENLSDIPVQLLEAAVRAHIQASPWFPHISDLRRLAERLAGGQPFDALPDEPFDSLAARALALEDAFYYERHLDPAEWRALADEFQAAGRPHRAEHTLEKLRRLEGM